jgi:TonB family protein
MRILFLSLSLLLVLIPSALDARNLPAGVVTSQMTINTRVGTLHDAIRLAPRPVVPDGARWQGHGVFIIDIDPSNGATMNVRVLQSTGNEVLDAAAVTALRGWVFRPRSVYKATVPIEFGRSGRIKIGA